MAGVKEKRSSTLRRRLREHGLTPLLIREFHSRHVLLGGVEELAPALAEAANRLRVKDGLAWSDHRLVLEAVKA